MDYDEFLETVTYDQFVDMSATTVALCLSALTYIMRQSDWQRNGNPLTSSEWDEIDEYLAIANEEIMSSLVGVILPHIMASVSAFKMLPCDGSVYNKSDYPQLYDALDSVYIISGTQFRVPDMRDRAMVGTGANYTVDDSGGVDSVSLTIPQIPSHTHGYTQPTFGIDIESVGVPDPTGVGNPPIALQTTPTGGGQSHENRMPYRAVKFAIIAG